MDLAEYIGERIREFRQSVGYSQEQLANKLSIANNTVSRWETGTYKPSIKDLERMSVLFGRPIIAFFPEEEKTGKPQVTALLRAAEDLPDDDVKELQRYAEYRRARHLLSTVKKKSPGRPRKGTT